MKKGSVRIEKIEIENFKNVKKGQVTLKNNRKNYKSSILGIYGQKDTVRAELKQIPFLIAANLCYYLMIIHVQPSLMQIRRLPCHPCTRYLYNNRTLFIYLKYIRCRLYLPESPSA